MDGERDLPDVTDAGALEERGQVSTVGSGELRFVVDRRIELTGDLPAGAERAVAAAVVPDGGSDDTARARDPSHLAQAGDRIRHEVDDELGQCRVEARVLERQRLGWCLTHVHVRMTLAQRFDEGLRRIRGSDSLSADPSHELAGECAWARANVDDVLPVRDLREVGEQRRERRRVPAHEAVIRLGRDGEAHSAESTLRAEQMRGRRATAGRGPWGKVAPAVVTLAALLLLPSGASGRSASADATLEQQVGQLLVLSFKGQTAPGYVLDALQARRVAGVILFGGNIRSPEQLGALTHSLRRRGGRPIVAVDQEGGSVRRVPWAPPVRSAAEQFAVGTARSDAAAAARALRAVGVTVSLAPVADVPSVRDSALAGRAFSRDPLEVAAAVREAVRGWRAGGVSPAVKHFPGLGGAGANTDRANVVVRRSRANLEAVDLAPFRAAIAAGVPIVMVGHARYPALDRSRIASQSSAIIVGLLRDELRFRGVVVTDSMEARASLATGSITDTSERAVRAGADLLLLTGKSSYAPVYRHLLDVARRDPPFRARVAESAERVRVLKAP